MTSLLEDVAFLKQADQYQGDGWSEPPGTPSGQSDNQEQQQIQVSKSVALSEPLEPTNQQSWENQQQKSQAQDQDGKLSKSEHKREPVIADDNISISVSQLGLSEPPSELLLKSVKEDRKTLEASIPHTSEHKREPLIISDESSNEEVSLVENERSVVSTPVELLFNEAEDSKKQSASIPPVGELPRELPSDNENSNEEASSFENNQLPSESPSSTIVSGNSQIPNNLTGVALARRLSVSPGSISRNKNKENFGQWASQHDRDGVTWHFDGEKFISVIPSDVEEKPL